MYCHRKFRPSLHIAYLEQLVGRLTVAVDIHERALTLLREKTDPDAQGENGSSE